MTKRTYNFSAGPAMLPTPVMEQLQKELLDFKGLGASVIEISHQIGRASCRERVYVLV